MFGNQGFSNIGTEMRDGEWSWLERKNFSDSHKKLDFYSIDRAHEDFSIENTTLQPTFPHHGLKVEGICLFLTKIH